MVSTEYSQEEQDLENDLCDDLNIPSEFVCPLTLEIMNDPVVSRYGKNFERSSILQWLREGHDTCPLTRQPMILSDLVTDHRLRLNIYMWKKANDVEIQLFMQVPESVPDVFGFITLKDDSAERTEDDPAVIFELRRPSYRRTSQRNVSSSRSNAGRVQNHIPVSQRSNRPRLLRMFRPTPSTEIEL